MLLILPLILPIIAALLLWVLPKDDRKLCDRFMLISLAISVIVSALAVLSAEKSVTLWQMTETIHIGLRTDGLARFYVAFISVVWMMVGIYSISYNAHDVHYRRYNCFFLATYGVLMGLSMSANAITFYMFYEMMTLITLPLVMHTMEKEAVAAGIKYLIYSVFGASAALLGIFFMMYYGTTLDFTVGGVLDAAKIAGNENLLLVVGFVMILGFSVKAGMFPMHAWLPTAHPVAPAPASAVLSGVITKMGVLGIIRVIFYLVGPELIRGTWVQYAFMTLALITVFMGSLLALRENVLKKRLAYSSVSQVSYILFGISTLHPIGFVGALLHIVSHSLIKNTLFLSAGAIIHETGKTRADELTGIGKIMPRVLCMFTIVSLGLIGIPPTGGFISKWYLAEGSLALGNWIGPAILLCSALMTAGYLLPVTIHGYFPGEAAIPEGHEASKLMWIPMLVLAVLSVVVGMFPNGLIHYIQSIASMLFA